ncbi:cytidine deaminase [uncultured Enterovirga sp.]|uniref:cytidine deaminase n=1 Tax=uncultured Enterovirga sp. TaxID=2026352 RepID=UPI0035CBDDCC
MPQHSQIETAFRAALAARRHAYAPYSGYAVGAALLTDDGAIFAGCNVENASYPVGTCAEAGAIAAMVAGGARRISAMVVVADGDELVAPCGACRQRMMEFADPEAVVHFARPGGIERSCDMADLLPMAFGPGALRAALGERA